MTAVGISHCVSDSAGSVCRPLQSALCLLQWLLLASVTVCLTLQDCQWTTCTLPYVHSSDCCWDQLLCVWLSRTVSGPLAHCLMSTAVTAVGISHCVSDSAGNFIVMRKVNIFSSWWAVNVCLWCWNESVEYMLYNKCFIHNLYDEWNVFGRDCLHSDVCSLCSFLKEVCWCILNYSCEKTTINLLFEGKVESGEIKLLR
jgi:hypothetical protein